MERREERRPLSRDAVSASPSVVRLRCGRRKRNMTNRARKKANAPNAGYTTPLNWLAVGNALMMYTRSVGRTRCTVVLIVVVALPFAPVVDTPAAPAPAAPAPAPAADDGAVVDIETTGTKLGIVRRLVVVDVANDADADAAAAVDSS